MAALEGGEYTFRGDGVKTTESGAALQVGKRHREQQFGNALICKRVTYHIYSSKVEHNAIVLLYHRQQILTYTLAQWACTKILSVFLKTECYHSSSNSLSFKNVSLYCAATLVRLATTSAGLISLLVRICR